MGRKLQNYRSRQLSMKTLTLSCGVDEAGRGPLAGPVYAAAVILDPDNPVSGLADSKTLKPLIRERLAKKIKLRALAWYVASASVEEIDRLNILRASLLAMKRAVMGLSVYPGEVLVDGLHCPDLEMPMTAIIKGDKLIPEISAASILAKVTRDETMMSLHLLFPNYGFDKHKGYPTPEHLENLTRFGATDVHRKSFAPVRVALNAGQKMVNSRITTTLE